MEEKSQFVLNLNDKGYTLVEMLISLTLFLAFAALTPLMFSTIFSTSEKPLNQQEISLFMEQADKEIQGSFSAENRWNRLHLIQPNGDDISYERNGNRIVRKVNGSGFEIVLQNIHGFEAVNSRHSVELIIEAFDKEYKHKTILVQPFVNKWKDM